MKQLIENANINQLEKCKIIYSFINNRNPQIMWKTIEERINLKGETDIHEYVNQVIKEVLTS